MNKRLLTAAAVLLSTSAWAQKPEHPNWFNKDFAQDTVRGMSVERAYAELLRGRPSRQTIVAVIDSGVDIEHEDLQGKIWVNTREIAGNGKDDDGNGFIDDVNGWDFLGGADGRDIHQEQLEVTRMYRLYRDKFGENPSKRTLRRNKSEWEEYQKIKKEIDDKVKEANQYLPMYRNMYEAYQTAEGVLKKHLNVTELTPQAIEGIKEEDVDRPVRQAKAMLQRLMAMGASGSQIKEGIKHFEDQIKYSYNVDHQPRSIVGDDLTKLQYGQYGNNEVKGPDARHGTHVAGIIAANRANELGMKGVADNVKIMVIRAVPDGDERDKDVANAIRYAADNGAHIINMSFGKSRSPEKKWVDEAIQYAMSKGLLIVAAAGNDSKDVDRYIHYPSKFYTKGGQADNFISVGASEMDDESLVASFSNYGRKTVNVFAPGVFIYSTVPGSKYEDLQGTSMASPATAGVAALLKSYFPELTAAQLYRLIIDNVVALPELKVEKPGSESKVPFGELSTTGGVVNAYKAIQAAIKLTEGK